MALVAYDNSDSSEYEDEDGQDKPVVELTNKPKELEFANEVPKSEIDQTTPGNGVTLFNLLPQPSTKTKAVVEEDDEFLHKKEIAYVKPKAKITVPSLNDFKDVESTLLVLKPKLATTKKSGLLSILPQPRNGLLTSLSKPLIPNILSQKPNVKKKTPLPSPMKKLKPDTKVVTENSDESDDDMLNDFFSFNKPVELPEPLELPLELPTKGQSAEPKMSKLESYFKKDVVEDQVVLQPNVESHSDYADSEAGSSYSNDTEAETANTTEMVLDDEAIQKLCGSRGKRRREEIQIVDVNQKEVLAEAQQWLLKGLMDDTSKRVSASKKRGNEPTNMQRRKHQITYLAHQAKANEVELQNQWANNRMTKRKTQSKYGF